MNHLRDLMNGAISADARATDGDVLADALRSGVRRRVRTRRGVRAVGVGSAAAVSVGAVAFGAARLPLMTEQQPGVSPGDGDCPPGTIAVEVEVSDDEAMDLTGPGGTEAEEGEWKHKITSLGTEIVDGEEVETFEIEVWTNGTPSPTDPESGTVCATPAPEPEGEADMGIEPTPAISPDAADDLVSTEP